MRSKRNALLLSYLILIGGSSFGCTTVEVVAPLPCPDRPTLQAIPEDMQLRMGEDAVLIVGENQLAMKEYARRLEVRAGCQK